MFAHTVGWLVLLSFFSVCQRGVVQKASMHSRIRKCAKTMVRRRMKRMKIAWKAVVGMVAERARARSV